MSIHRIFAGISSAIVLMALVWGFVLVGSPISSRRERFDERRMQDLQIINQTILDIVYEGRQWEPSEDGSLRQPLPESLGAVANQAVKQRVNIVDSETSESYGYRVTGQTTYELCATFNALRDEPYDIFWNHGKGRTCFRFDALRAGGLAGGEHNLVVPKWIE